MTKQEKQEIAHVVNEAIRRAMSQYEERWLCEKEFLAQFQMFNHLWLKQNGHLLGRTRVYTNDEEGEHKSCWAYPRNKVQELIMNNKLNFEAIKKQ